MYICIYDSCHSYTHRVAYKPSFLYSNMNRFIAKLMFVTYINVEDLGGEERASFLNRTDVYLTVIIIINSYELSFIQ